MKSNGFGRFAQTIIISVVQSDVEAVARRLDASRLPSLPDSISTAVEWKRSTIKRRDDDDIVWELNVMLGELSGKIEWNIDWERSEY